MPLLRDRLSLYGGTALAFVYFPETYRLSVDVDFSYRHNGDEDWGTVRKGIDGDMNAILYCVFKTSIEMPHPGPSRRLRHEELEIERNWDVEHDVPPTRNTCNC